ncbi:MAG: DUF3179 domain-containing protein [Vicinamibacterales bacterium]
MRASAPVLVVRLLMMTVLAMVSWTTPGVRASQPTQAPPISLFLDAGGADARVAEAALATLGRQWRDGYTPMFIDMARLLVPRRVGDEVVTNPVRTRLIRFLERQTRQDFGDDLNAWRAWMWNRPYEPHPDYAAFKAAIYATIDPQMRRFFATPTATIRLDEVDWGGVAVNGIPPLDHPKVVSAKEAAYLRDNHIVFGLVVNGEPRAYPKRILAWHEMALDRVGGTELTVVYCTLCGTVIPYKSVVGGIRRTFGTSGLLYRANKLMFDRETMSLWSTLDGRPVIGTLAGQPLILDAVPVVTTTWGEWRQQHPTTSVLSVDTGHDRDYSEGAAYREYFDTDRLMFRVPKLDTRLKNKDEVLGVLVPAVGGGRQAMAFSTAYLARQRVHHETVEGRTFVVLTSPRGANRVFEVGAVRMERWLDDVAVMDTTGHRWTVTEEALIPGGGARAPLQRVTAFRAFWFGWYAQFPDTVLVK